MTSVLDFGADPTGTADSTAAILAAIAATPVSGTVCFPYTSSGGNYLCDADQINAAGRRLRGEAAHAFQISEITARTAGTALVTSSSECAIENLFIDGNNNVDYGIHLTGADRSEVTSVVIADCNQWGLFVFEGESLYLRGAYADSCANGIRVVGSSNSEFYNCGGNNNTGVGIYVAGPGSGLTTERGNIKWFGGAADFNAAGPQMILDGAEACLFSGIYLEGVSPGARFINECFNNTFEFMRVVLGDAITDFAFDLQSASKNTFIGCSAPGNNGRRVKIMEANCAGNSFIGCFRASFLASTYMTLYHDDGVSQYTCEQRAAGFVGSAAPTVGQWEVGDVVWNDGATPTGWRCTAGGAPGTWVAF